MSHNLLAMIDVNGHPVYYPISVSLSLAISALTNISSDYWSSSQNGNSLLHFSALYQGSHLVVFLLKRIWTLPSFAIVRIFPPVPLSVILYQTLHEILGWPVLSLGIISAPHSWSVFLTFLSILPLLIYLTTCGVVAWIGVHCVEHTLDIRTFSNVWSLDPLRIHFGSWKNHL